VLGPLISQERRSKESDNIYLDTSLAILASLVSFNPIDSIPFLLLADLQSGTYIISLPSSGLRKANRFITVRRQIKTVFFPGNKFRSTMTASSATFSGRSRRFHRLAGTVNVGVLAFLALSSSSSSSSGHFGLNLGLGLVHAAAVAPEMTRGDKHDDNDDLGLDHRRLKGRVREPTAAEPTAAEPTAPEPTVAVGPTVAQCGTCDAGTPNAGATCSTSGPTAECGTIRTDLTCSKSSKTCADNSDCNGKGDKCNVQTPVHGTCTLVACTSAPTGTPSKAPTQGPTRTPSKAPTGTFLCFDIACVYIELVAMIDFLFVVY